MIRKAIAGFFCLSMWGTLTAHGHFVWVDLKDTSGGGQRAELYLSELPEPGEPHLIGKVAQSKAWLRSLDGTKELKLAPDANKENAALIDTCPKHAAASLEAVCDYGVYSRGPSGVLLNYYAKRLTGDWSKHAEKLARAERLALDIVPSIADDKINVLVLYNGKPSAGELVIVDPAGGDHELKTDAEGRASLALEGEGRYALRAAHIEMENAGTRDGKKYSQVWHYATLVLDARPASPAAAAKDEKPPAGDTALAALERARDGRAIWHDFPGFTADLTVTSGGEKVTGKMTIDAGGTVEVQLAKSPLADWVEEQLNSLVQHRMPDGEVTQGDVRWSDDDLAHPLGRKIDLSDPDLQSAYRLKDDVIMEVNRSMGKVRFTISVLETVRNAENKYLPRSFTMNFFDAATGELRTSLGYWNEWQRVGKFDLPKTIVEVAAAKGGAGTKQIAFSNCKLIEAGKDNAN